jgi:hypothetical protein
VRSAADGRFVCMSTVPVVLAHAGTHADFERLAAPVSIVSSQAQYGFPLSRERRVRLAGDGRFVCMSTVPVVLAHAGTHADFERLVAPVSIVSSQAQYGFPLSRERRVRLAGDGRFVCMSTVPVVLAHAGTHADFERLVAPVSIVSSQAQYGFPLSRERRVRSAADGRFVCVVNCPRRPRERGDPCADFERLAAPVSIVSSQAQYGFPLSRERRVRSVADGRFVCMSTVPVVLANAGTHADFERLVAPVSIVALHALYGFPLARERRVRLAGDGNWNAG